MLEHYSCGGSPYWAAKAFNLLMIPPEDPFWKTREAPLPIHQGDYAHALPSAGLLLVGDQDTGHVQLINQKSYHDKPEYNDKYTKFAYSLGVQLRRPPIHHNFNCDNVLQFSEDGINFRQRWDDGDAPLRGGLRRLEATRSTRSTRRGTIHTSILVKGDFMVNLHRVAATKALVFKEGGYPAGLRRRPRRGSGVARRRGEAAYKDGKLTFITQPAGYTRQCRAQRFGDDVNGANVRYRQQRGAGAGARGARRPAPLRLASLVCGRVGKDSLETLLGLVTEFRARRGRRAPALPRRRTRLRPGR